MHRMFLFLIPLVLLAQSVAAQADLQKNDLRKDDFISDSLSENTTHSYPMELDSAQFVFGQVFQETVDVVITVYDPNGKKINSYDGPARGAENFSFESDMEGDYRIEIKPFEDTQGRYSLEIKVVEPIASTPSARVDQLMTPYKGRMVPGAAVMVMKDGAIIFQEAYGMANLTYDVPFETDTRTNIGSTSKQFTAYGIALLAQQGKLSLDDDIRKYFPELPDFGKTVTIRNLLTHTSGYREYINTLALTGRDLSSPLDREKVIQIVQNQPELQNEPGEEWNYNNTGYALLSLLIEKITDTPFPQWMKENVFEPLDMKHTIVRENQNKVVPGRSVGYTGTKSGDYEEATDLGGAMGAGGIYTTLEDLAKWIRNLEDPRPDHKQVIEEMTTPFVLFNGKPTNYGLGLSIEKYKGLKYIHHGGADVAHRSMLMYFPEIAAAVVTQSNSATFDGSIPKKIADIFFDADLDTENSASQNEKGDNENFIYDAEDFDKLTGRYELDISPGFIINFKRNGDRIFAQATGQPEVDLEAVSDSVFSLKQINARITFHLNKEKSADSLTLHQNGNHLARRVTWEPKREELQQYTGKYFSEEIETLYTIELEEEDLILMAYSLEDIKLTPSTVDSFGGKFPIFEISFIRNEQGEISGFKVSNVRTRGVVFKKQY